MDVKALETKLDRILAMRGDPAKGVGAEAWTEALAGASTDLVLAAIIAAVRELLLQEWIDRRKADLRPQAALDAAESWLQTRSADSLVQAKAAAKACTQARNETYGDGHRVPEAARHAAWAPNAKDTTGLFEAIAAVEAELLSRIALTGEYHRGPEQRRAIVTVLKRVILPPEKAAEPAVAAAPSTGGAPVPYSPDGHFELGQVLAHKKFGEVSVTSVGETWIEVTVSDGTKKRLTHKP